MLLSCLGVQASEKSLRLDLEVADDATWAQGDSHRVSQVLLNLLGNAVKFTEVGGVQVRICVRNRVVRCEVADTGLGVERDQQPRMFKKFSQAGTDISRKYGGTGLGLAISKQLVELMGGSIGFKSEPGRGSTFWFELPAGAVCKKALAEPDRARTALSAFVLVVDDNGVNRKLARRVLETLGCRV